MGRVGGQWDGEGDAAGQRDLRDSVGHDADGDEAAGRGGGRRRGSGGGAEAEGPPPGVKPLLAEAAAEAEGADGQAGGVKAAIVSAQNWALSAGAVGVAGSNMGRLLG